MDDPWRNAWSASDTATVLPDDDPWKPTPSPGLDVAPAVSTWEPPAWPEDPMQSATVWTSGSSAQDELSEPSEPSEAGNTGAEEPESDDELEPELQHEPEPELEYEPASAYEEQSSPMEHDTPVNPFAAPLPELSTRLSRSPSPDAFGTFETADVDDTTPIDDAWRAPAQTSQARPTAGRSLWSTSEWQQDDDADQDEWAAASARHRLEAERERRFPQEAVQAILAQWEHLAADLWPPPEDDAKSEGDGSQPAVESRLDSIPGLTDLMASIVPDYHLQPLPQLLKTSTFKSMQASIRLTKSYAMVQASPLSQFYSSKGSSAWESSLKAKEIVKDDFPWAKPQESMPTPAAAPQTEKPSRGGILSLWTRRPPSMPPQPKAESPAPASRTASPAPQRQSIDKPRPSIDSAQSTISKDTSKASATSSPVVPAATASVPDVASPASPVEAAPSAMSRLFSRFSRSTKQATAVVGESPSDTSIPLSASDVSFLSDVVPSSSGSRLIPGDDILGVLGAPSSSSGFILPSKLPAPLAPPPKAQSLLAGQTVQAPGNRWEFEDDDELGGIQEDVEFNATLDAFLGGGNSTFQQGYAPLSSKQKKLPIPVPSPPRVPKHTAILPSSVLAVERDASSTTSFPLAPPPPRVDSPLKRAIPPPSSLLGGDEFDDFMSTPAQSTPPAQAISNFASPSGAPLVASQPMSTTVQDDFGDFGDFMSPPTSPPIATTPTVRPQTTQLAMGAALPPPRREARLPDPPRANTRTPVAVISRSGSVSGSAPALAPPPPSASRAPTVVMSRSTAGGSTPAPLLAPPPGSSRLAAKQNFLEQQDGDLLSEVQSASPASASSPSTTQHSPVQSPIRPESRSSLPMVPRSGSPSLFEELARPVSRNSLPASNGLFSTIPAVSSPLAQSKTIMSPSFNGDAFSLFDSAPVASAISPPTKEQPPNGTAPKAATMPAVGNAQNGKLSAADLSFFDSL